MAGAKASALKCCITVVGNFAGSWKLPKVCNCGRKRRWKLLECLTVAENDGGGYQFCNCRRKTKVEVAKVQLSPELKVEFKV